MVEISARTLNLGTENAFVVLKEVNELLAKGALKPEDKSGAGEYRQIDLKVIRPAGPLNIELTDFDDKDIQRLLALGREAAESVIGGP